jgi:hypothetical protein
MDLSSAKYSFVRLKTKGGGLQEFTEAHLERLRAPMPSQAVAAKDGTKYHWGAGDHVLDRDFALEKNIIGDALRFTLVVTTNTPPADLLKAYVAEELSALAKDNPSGLPSKRQRKEAKEAAQDRLEHEAKDGRYLRRKAIGVLWDRVSGEVLFGSTSAKVIEVFAEEFEIAFGPGLCAVTAASLAHALAEARGTARNIEDAEPSPFVAGKSTSEVAWMGDSDSKDFIGNEFLVWLWEHLDGSSEEICLDDGSSAAVMIYKTMHLDCPRGQTGSQTVKSAGPSKMPESYRALLEGKWPRKAGLILARHQQQYELTLVPEIMAVSGLKLPAIEDGGQNKAEERVTQLRHFLETLDLLYDRFVAARASSGWRDGDVKRIRGWVESKEVAA